MNAADINAILDRMPVIYWPVFLAELVWLRLFKRDLWSETGGFVMLGVTRTGRIVVLGMFINDAPDEADWTRYAPRAPWLRRDPDRPAASVNRACPAMARQPHLGAGQRLRARLPRRPAPVFPGPG